MKLHNEILLRASVEAEWAALNDMPRVARCAAGATLLEERADGSCVGTLGVRLGPVAMSFKGVVEFLERDAAARRVVARARGAEEKARGSAMADVVFRLEPAEDGSRVVVDTDLTLTGAIAQYGRGAALLQGVAQALMSDFVRNMEADMAGGAVAADEASAARLVARGLWNAGVGALRGAKKED